MAPATGATAYVVNHVVLPLDLPQTNDYDIEHERYLLEVTIHTLQDLRTYAIEGKDGIIISAIAAIKSLMQNRDNQGYVSEASLLVSLEKTAKGATDSIIPLDIRTQNAGLLVCRRGSNVFFEAFELSPTNEATMNCKGRLNRVFPGLASQVSIARMQDVDFRKSIASTLTKMSLQGAPDFQPQNRANTTDPGLVTDYFMSVIAAAGEPVGVVHITKHTRDEVLSKHAQLPWRRSPLWLLTRVTLQLIFSREGHALSNSDELYKAFGILLLSRILAIAKGSWNSLGSDSVRALVSKTIRRLHKFKDMGKLGYLRPDWQVRVRNNLTNIHNLMGAVWSEAVANPKANIDNATLLKLRPDEGLDLTLPNLDEFLSTAAPSSSSKTSCEFTATSECPTFAPDKVPDKLNDADDNHFYQLVAMETWVEKHLKTWSASHSSNPSSCGELRRLMHLYHSNASPLYAGNPASMSIMYLTLCAIWVQCDTLACLEFPLLTKYDPEVQLEVLQSLSLPLRKQMELLQDLESYVQSRRRAATKEYPSVCSDFGGTSSFAVRYFDSEQGAGLRLILAEVERIATEQMRKKRVELEDVKREYCKIMEEYNNGECDYDYDMVDDDDQAMPSQHREDCTRCALKDEATALDIVIYEKPLSSTLSMAKATVFELKAPEAFSDWRDATQHLITNVFEIRDETSRKPPYTFGLEKHVGLSDMLPERHSNRRITIVSTAKSYTARKAPLRGVMSLEEEDVCLENGLRYTYYDKEANACVEGAQKSTGRLPQKCLYTLPERAQALKRYLSRSPSAPDGLPNNEVIADQVNCPVHISAEEYKALATIPLGSRIMYHNILVQLAMPSLDFAKTEAQCLLQHIIHQAGPPNGELGRTLHSILQDEGFCNSVLVHLETALRNMSENWESWKALATFTLLARRILSLNAVDEVIKRSLGYLGDVRQICLTWLRTLGDRAMASTNHEQRFELHLRTLDIALLCSSTFELDEIYFQDICKHSTTITALIQCSIMIKENEGSLGIDTEGLTKIMYQSWRRLMYRLLPTLQDQILFDNDGLNQAILRSWANFQPSPTSRWTTLNERQGQWLQTASGSFPVHFDLLTGELLVNGRPLTRLPTQFTKHTMYTQLFGKNVLEVGPSDVPGMDFAARSMRQGYNLHFGLQGEDMLVMAAKPNSRLDSLPCRLFDNDLPHEFVSAYIHWYDRDRDEVIFRSRSSPWVQNNEEWRLQHSGAKWRLVKGLDTFVNATSQCASTLLQIFRPLEDISHIHITWNATSQTLNIVLPRLQLEFYIVQGTDQLRSRQYRTMIVDANQNLETLVGLVSKLVLRGMDEEERVILIPLPREFGVDSVKYAKVSNPHHAEITIARQDAGKICAYTLDTTLRRIIDSGDMQSKLLLAYLHGLTSHCLPDPFTGYTGTEAALTILSSAATRSFGRLTTENVNLLTSIAKLTPGRTLHAEATQQIHWDDNLSASSQDPGFHRLTRDIISEAQKTMFLHPGSDSIELEGLPVIKPHLQERDELRSSTFKVDGFGAENFTRNADVDYTARDTTADSSRGQRAFAAAKMIIQDSPAIHKAIPHLTTGLFKAHLENVAISSQRTSYDLANLSFDVNWLGESPLLLADNWCSLHASLPKAAKKCNTFNIMMWLSTMAYSNTADMDAVSTLGAFYRLSDLATVKIPTANPSFDRSRGSTWAAKEVDKIVASYKKSLIDCPEGKIPREDGEDNKEHTKRLNALRRKPQREAMKKLVNALREQWPCNIPSTPSAKDIKLYFNVSEVMLVMKARFKAWHDNMRFNEYLDSLSTVLARQKIVSIPASRRASLPSSKIGRASSSMRHYALNDIFAAPPPTKVVPMSAQSPFIGQHESLMLTPPSEPMITLMAEHRDTGNQVRTALKGLCRDLGLRALSKCEGEYVKALRLSCTALEHYELTNTTRLAQITDETQKLLKEHLLHCKNHFEALTLVLAQVVHGEAESDKNIACLVQQAPRISPLMWLRCLTREWFICLSEPWKDAIIEHALAITRLHRARRMAALFDKPLELAQELQNAGHTNWSPGKFPETLLLEAESGILIREVQETIASQMRNPPEDKNSVCQLNMGEGKSSVIVPMLATALADTKRLVRIIIAKPQSTQMLQMLVCKLGGLLNRRVYHLPFSRELRLSANEAKTVQSIFQECIDSRGVILAQPEHILSFKLMSIENVLIERQEVASSLLEAQQFLETYSRDIVDESDENFSPHFELIYTMGSQQAIEFAPERWIIVQQILGLLSKYAPEVKHHHQLSIDIQHTGDGTFPRVRLLRDDATDMLLRLIAKHVVKYGLIGLSTRTFSGEEEQAALEHYILQSTLSPDQIQAVEGSNFWTDSTKDAILLVRGLIACGILRHILSSKRWRVNYGLDPDRTPSTLLAVPYRFKDGPSRAEYSHPEVLILLTLLSHYYGGLSDDQMFHTFEHLSKSDQSAVEYNEWIDTAASTLPTAFRTLAGINLKDRQHCNEQIFPHLRFSKACIDYFVSRLVFPKEFKQYTSKLSASGWDMGAAKTNPTTGFSGTKDTMHLLPLEVKHLDLLSQSHTNALVLGYLMNTSEVKLLPPRLASTDAEHILTAAVKCEPEVRVVLDCGAAILEQSNRQVVEVWLKLTKPAHVHAAVFFQEEELSVLDRTGRVESLQTSPYAKQLDLCVVYLDEAHARGTDLRLPRNYRACLTLGRALCKDKLIQGCMRMRQLGKGQSVVFLVPEEITTKIYEITSNDFDEPITVRDVLIWSISETWLDLKKSMPLWAVQGHRHITQQQLSHDVDMTLDQAKEYLEDEGQTIESRYGPGMQGNKLTARSKDWNMKDPSIAQIVQRCQNFGAMSLTSADLEEEQERELAPEQEEERQAERPKMMEAASHSVHAHILYLVQRGAIQKKTKQFLPAFQALESTSAVKLFKLAQFPSDLLVTADFMHTVKKPAGTRKATFITDSFQRAVQWVLSVPDPKKPGTIKNLVIISPHEANMLLPQIRRSKKVTLHLFSPRVNSIHAPLDALDLYTVGHDFMPGTVPGSLTAQLNLFAGSLYLNSYKEYTELCDLLGLLHSDAKKGQQVSADGFITPPTGTWKLKESPVPFLRALLLRIRKEGEGLEKTHLGKILSGVRLEESDFGQDTDMSGT